MIYDKLTPMLDSVYKMLYNKDSSEKVYEFYNKMYPEIKKAMLVNDIQNCTRCALFPCNHVIPTGPMSADIMFVSHTVDHHEEKAKKLFVGDSGAIFDKMLCVAEEKLHPQWARDSVYITSLVKCLPTDGLKPRLPSFEEITQCEVFLKREIETVNPDMIICVGELAAKNLIHHEFDMAKEQGKVFGDNPKKVGIYHPEDVLALGEGTDAGVDMKNSMWNALVTANEAIEWPF